MSTLLEFSLFEFLKNALSGLGKLLTLDLIFYMFVGLEIVCIIYFIIKTHFSYELRLLRTLDKINLYLLSNPYIKEENLIEFNRIMKRVPHTLRYHWQQYMLNRDKPASHYMSSDNVIEKPLKSSALATNLKTCWFLTALFALVSTVFVFANLYAALDTFSVTTTLLYCSIIPAIIFILGSVTVALLRLRKDAGIKELYNVFHIYQNLMDKACTTIPQYVDFEVLFTQKEIAKGIPALNDYLEKRDRQIQEEMEKARLNAIEHEVYDFEQVDINGSLILERALKESEVYFNLRIRLTNEIQQIDGEIESLQKTYDNTQRDFQRKIQASKENVTRLRQQLEATTNRIDSNYIRKQITDEVNKQQQLEKDNDDATVKFQQELATLKQEIDKRKQELASQKDYLEKAMLSEYDTYSGKVYKGLKELVEKRDKEARIAMASRQEMSNKEISALKERNENLKLENESLREKIDKIGRELTEKDLFYTQALLNHAAASKKEIDLSQKPVSEYQLEQQQKEMNNADDKYDEYGGYYDEEGYYRYKNGTYYDPEGNFFDEYGGHYDKLGNYYPPEGAGEELKPAAQAEVAEQDNQTIVDVENEQAQQPESAEQAVQTEAEAPVEDVAQTPAAVEDVAVEHEVIQAPDKAKTEEPLGQAEQTPAPVDDIVNKGEEQDKKDEAGAEKPAEDEAKAEQEEIAKQEDVDSAAQLEEQLELSPEQKLAKDLEERAEEIAERAESANLETSKTATAEPDAEKTIDDTTENKKKPGRPRKVVSQEELNKPKGKPGRPKKVVSEEELNKPKGKPGRPRKVVSQEELNKPKGKPGRPRKNVSDELNEIQNKINQENQVLESSKEDLANVLSSITDEE